jgi:hypothetical protein
MAFSLKQTTNTSGAAGLRRGTRAITATLGAKLGAALGAALVAVTALAADRAAASSFVIDNFRASCGTNQVLQNRGGFIAPTPTTVSTTFTVCDGSSAEILGGSRAVTITHLVGGKDIRSHSAQFSDAGMWLGVGGFLESDMLLEWLAPDPLNVAALGSAFRLNTVRNMISSGGSKGNNLGLPEETSSGQQVTLSLTDTDGRTGATTAPILFPGTDTGLRLYTYPFVEFAMGDLLADNAALDLTKISGISLLFDFKNGYSNSQLLRVGEGTSGFTVAGDAFEMPGGTTTAVPLPAAGWVLLAGLGALGALRRRG